VSGLEQTVRILPNKIALFHLVAPSSQAGARNAQEFDMRIRSARIVRKKIRVEES